MKHLFVPAIFFNSTLKLAPRLILIVSLMTSSVGILGYLLYQEYDAQISSLSQSEEKNSNEIITALEAKQFDLVSFVFIISSAFIYFMMGSFLHTQKSIKQLRSICQAIAEGDFSLKPNHNKSSDELSFLNDDLDYLSKEFQRILISMSEMAAEVHNASSELNTLSKQEAENSTQQTNAISNISAAIQETSTSTSQIVEKTKSMANIAEQSDEQASHGSIVVKDAIEAIQKVASTINTASLQVDKLGESSARINNIIEVIQNIAAQTNLLALNAAIEAARAGEHGRGFSVVSDEVRQLATRTHDATGQVREMIDTIQSEINSIVTSIKSTENLVNQGVESTNTVGETLANIRLGVASTLNATQEISGVVKEQSIATQEIARSVETINQMVLDNDADIAEAMAAATYMEELSESMLTTLSAINIAKG